MPANSSTAASYDLVIAGAGVSGLFAAWRLLRANPGLRVVILEKLPCTGGRLQTTIVQVADRQGHPQSVKDEEGGMRFRGGDEMPFINTLVKALGLEGDKVPFLMELKGTLQRYHFRGTAFTSENANAMWSQLYKLAPGETNQSAAGVLLGVLLGVLQATENWQYQQQFHGTVHDHPDTKIPSGAEEWQIFRNRCTFGGTTMNQWGFWALLRWARLPGGATGLSSECIEWLEHAIGFMGPTQAFINAGESLQIIFDFPAKAEFITLARGMQSIPNNLETWLRSQPNVTFRFGEQVQGIEAVPGGGVTVYTDAGGYTAAQTILALPHAALAAVIAKSKMLQGNAAFSKAVDSVQDMFLSKIGLYYDQRWWHGNAINLSCGANFTDLPLGSVYCFQQYPKDLVRDASYDGPAALTIYNDYDRAAFWMEMQNLGGPYQSPQGIAQPANTQAASTVLVAEATRQLMALFSLPPQVPPPTPVLSTFRVWGAGQYGHGYHQYKIGFDDMKDVDPHIWNPVPGTVFVCNESWSPEQGWIEGALMATDRVLTMGFQLPPFCPPTPKKLRRHHIA